MALRQHYPDAALTAELLMVQGDQFVVRAELRRADQLLATGMAADANLEQAEDRARLRALDALGLRPAPQPLAVDVHLVTPEPVLPPEPEPELPPLPEEPPELAAEIHYEPPMEEPEPEIEVAPEPEPVAEARPRPRRRRAEEPQPEETVMPEPEPLLPLMAVAAPEPEPQPTAAHDDWSEELADIEVELKRLGWTQQQQQDHLQRTYGRRSLALITDYADLVDFLGYLRSLPMAIAEPPPPVVMPPVEPTPVPAPAAAEPVVAAAAPREAMMAETLALVKQLAWTNRQAVDHLQRTYGKATRQDLTDAELQDFLRTLTRLAQESDLAPF
jgi:hypothetical protein